MEREIKDIDKRIDEALAQQMQLPKGLQQRLEATIDDLATHERKVRSRRRSVVSLCGAVAATLLIVVGLNLRGEQPQPQIFFSQSVESEARALEIVDRGLQLFSDNLKVGAKVLHRSQSKIEKSNKILRGFSVLTPNQN